MFTTFKAKNNFIDWPLHYLASCLEDSDEVRSLLASQDREEEEAGPCFVESAVSCSQAVPQLPVPAAWGTFIQGTGKTWGGKMSL